MNRVLDLAPAGIARRPAEGLRVLDAQGRARIDESAAGVGVVLGQHDRAGADDRQAGVERQRLGQARVVADHAGAGHGHVADVQHVERVGDADRHDAHGQGRRGEARIGVEGDVAVPDVGAAGVVQGAGAIDAGAGQTQATGRAHRLVVVGVRHRIAVRIEDVGVIGVGGALKLDLRPVKDLGNAGGLQGDRAVDLQGALVDVGGRVVVGAGGRLVKDERAGQLLGQTGGLGRVGVLDAADDGQRAAALHADGHVIRVRRARRLRQVNRAEIDVVAGNALECR